MPQYTKLLYPKVMANSSPVSLQMGPLPHAPVSQSLHSSFTVSPSLKLCAPPALPLSMSFSAARHGPSHRSRPVASATEPARGGIVARRRSWGMGRGGLKRAVQCFGLI
eukprot:CAMPEP_0181376998 /NCGR_PEP_ID=MMETSP1106-20121128/17640_1 /TAXON_ID=81844 /ORGANISM="Mantoniella antarctica, Strain SL-175" /LENGTH=108 /DNA_ID=CAMNT_0023495659 /DNA_START=364 /DNA_END=690 /DNA_ORIENTATION=-